MLTKLLTLITSLFLGVFHPTQLSHTQVLASTTATTASATVSPASPLQQTPTPTPTPSVYKTTTPYTKVTIDCTGPDGKHFPATQKQCSDFNNAWNHTAVVNTDTAQKIGDHIYTMQYLPDTSMATPNDVLTALNTYREKNGAGILSVSPTLVNYAQSRADFYARNGKLDEHVGFVDYVNNRNGFAILGFDKIGENAAIAGPLTGIHLIEEVFAGDSEHNTNQLNPEWTHVGVGINGSYTDIIFASEKRQ